MSWLAKWMSYHLLGVIVRVFRWRVFNERTYRSIQFDRVRLRARMRSGNSRQTLEKAKLHFGCGRRRIGGWLNIDVANSERDLDLSVGLLPWTDNAFDAIVGQHVIEHFELESELLALLEGNALRRQGARRELAELSGLKKGRQKLRRRSIRRTASRSFDTLP